MLLKKYQAGVSNFNASTGSDRYITQGQSLTCPEGYTYDPYKKLCVSNSKSANFNNINGKKNEEWKDVPDFEVRELKNPKYIKGIPKTSARLLQTDFIETPEETGRGQHFETINIYPKPHYKLVVDKTRPEGYFDKQNNTLYTQNENSLHSKKFNEWNKAIELQESNINKVNNSKNVKFAGDINEAYSSTQKRLLDSEYANPLYYNTNLKTHEDYLKRSCSSCNAWHGSSFNTEGDYLIESRNKKNGKLVDKDEPLLLTSTTAAPTEGAYRRENYITYKPVEGTDYYTMHQDFRRGKEPYQTKQNGQWINNPKSKLLYHLDVNGNEITQPSREKILSEDQYKDMLKRGLFNPKVTTPTSNIAVNTPTLKNGGRLLIYKK